MRGVDSGSSRGSGGGGAPRSGEDPAAAAERAAIDVTTGCLVHYAGQPVEEIRCAAFALIGAVAEQGDGWGLRALFSNAAARHLILTSRGGSGGGGGGAGSGGGGGGSGAAGSSKRERECFFGMVEAVARSGRFAELLDAETVKSIRGILRAGPHGQDRSGGLAATAAPQDMSV